MDIGASTWATATGLTRTRRTACGVPDALQER